MARIKIKTMRMLGLVVLDGVKEEWIVRCTKLTDILQMKEIRVHETLALNADDPGLINVKLINLVVGILVLY